MKTNVYDMQYKKSLHELLTKGTASSDRTGVGTLKLFDVNFRVPIGITDNPFEYILPATTLRKVAPRIAFEELMWMLRGSTDVTELQQKNIKIWNGNSTRQFLDSVGLTQVPEWDIGKGYGYQMRNFSGVDQLYNTYKGLRDDPNGRRHLISFWNVGELKEMALSPCHLLYNFVVTGTKLNLKFYIRSNDSLLGQPTNIMFASFFLAIMAKAVGLDAGTLACSTGDYHLYMNHIEAAKILVGSYISLDSPTFRINKEFSDFDDMLNLEWTDIEVLDYNPNPALDKDLLVMAI